MGRNNLAGAWGEALAAEYLLQKGYGIRENGYRCRFGEIDLIAEKGGFLAFVEVKLRRSPEFAQAREFVDPKKQERLRLTASVYLAEQPTELQPRFDVIEIYAREGTGTGRPEINHIEDAFS